MQMTRTNELCHFENHNIKLSLLLWLFIHSNTYSYELVFLVYKINSTPAFHVIHVYNSSHGMCR